MQELIVASNPATRRKRKVSAKQRAAARRNIKKAQAANRRKRGGSAPRRRKNPSRRLARSTPARRAAYPRRRAALSRRMRRRRNPARGFGRILDAQVMPALVGGAGAVANDVAYNFAFRLLPIGTLPMLEQFRSGPLRHIGKGASAIALGWLSAFFLTRKQANQIGAGALTVVGYNVVRDLVTRFAPGVAMGEYLSPDGLGYYGAGLNPAMIPGNGMGEYLRPGLAQVPGSGVGIPRQLTQGTPYMQAGALDWPPDTSEEMYDYEM